MSRWRRCSVASCIRPAKAHGLCGAHYNRLRNQGSIKAEMPVRSLARKKIVLKRNDSA
jgi:hypothetical protein